MLFWLLSLIPDQDVDRHLIADEGEEVIDEVAHHWVVYLRPVLEVVLAVVLFVALLLGPLATGWILILLMLLLLSHAMWSALANHMDRFVITNMRVFRIHGVLAQSLATMPLTRILDITVQKPLLGRLLGYGTVVAGPLEIDHVPQPGRVDRLVARLTG